LIALIIPQPFLRIFTSDEQVITLGVKLLRIIGPSFLFTPIMNNYAFIMRSTGNVRLPMKVSISGILLNIVLGYALIFGVFGLPAMGAEGAAFANLIARVFECLLLIWIIYKIKAPLAVKPAQMFSFDTKFLKKVLGKVLPVTLNELLWGMGISAYAAIYAHISTESIAAVSIKDSVENLVFVPIMGITHACAIMVGNTIGSGDHEKPIQIVQQAVRIALLIAGGIGLAIVLTRQTITSFFNVSEITAFYARNLLLILGAVLWMRGLNTVFFIGMMRSGGDTRFAYWMDAGSMWFIGVPLALFAAMVLGLPVYYVNLIAMTDELVKFLISIWRYRSRRWIHNLVTS
jgi:putative MATE family efflux protein